MIDPRLLEPPFANKGSQSNGIALTTTSTVQRSPSRLAALQPLKNPVLTAPPAPAPQPPPAPAPQPPPAPPPHPFSHIQAVQPDRLTWAEAEKASRKISAKDRKLTKARLKEDIDKFRLNQELCMEDLAIKHNVTTEYIKKQLSAESNYRHTRAPNIYNAMVHAKSTEINTDLPAGERKHLQELQNIVSKTCNPSTLSKEERDDLCGRLLNHRETKSLGSRANNLAAARDVLVTANRIEKELNNLTARTGAYGCFFLTRGHIFDLGAPTWYGSNNSMDFWEDVVGRDPDELAMLFKQWACSRNQTVHEQEDLANCRQQCTRFCRSGLRKYTLSLFNYTQSLLQQEASGTKECGGHCVVPRKL
ncbi:hypothetical protein SERLA73DRAFT_75334 [Serpula lacrymans var. lacrymans S7.3]|uniref:Uncharacterized protein n=1 Tax=Serpula lacrymans var. lacrymans (strain S7.3) TaxID=936435 RepID=F8Q3B2_SERL3|nr:hypothetical protein SERLA73DRAFT_75334 [Serpula lacrymans var. lacrymans S7.3]